MPAPLRPMSTGELLDRTFSLYKSNFVLFAGISALPYGVLFAIQLLPLIMVAIAPASAVATSLVAGVIAIVAFIVYIVAVNVSHAATVFAVSETHLERPVTIGAAYARIRGSYRRLINVSISVGIRVFGGMLLLIVPGIILMCRYAVAIPAAVLENLKPSDAIKRSAALTQGDKGRIFVVYFLVTILNLAISTGVQYVVLTAFGSSFVPEARAAVPVGLQIAQLVSTFVVTTVVAPVLTIAFSLVYYDERIRKEAFDIQHMMSTLGITEASTAAAGTVRD